MSAIEESKVKENLRFVKGVWKLFPHVILILSLIGYAAFGAVLFVQIEGKPNNKSTEGYDEFLLDVVTLVKTAHNSSDSVHLKEVGKTILTNFKPVWLQSPGRWNFTGSLFFCCTVFTTVGYGEIYPVTTAGKAVCILYAMVGIPLMLLVISDVGDIMALLLSKAYLHLHNLLHQICRRHRNAPQQEPLDAVYTLNRDVVLVHNPVDIRHVMKTQGAMRTACLRNNMEIFDRIIARENFVRSGPLARSCSSPELNRMPPPPKDFTMWAFDCIGKEMDNFNVPLVLIVLVVFAYILLGSLILPIWETQLSTFDAFYFCFVTLTTIGFGDIVPEHPNFFMLTFIFIITGMVIMSMALKLGQSHIVNFYRQCMQCISGGKLAKYEEVENP